MAEHRSRRPDRNGAPRVHRDSSVALVAQAGAVA